MEIKEVSSEGLKKKLEVSVSSAVISQKTDDAIESATKTASIAGFRKGHVPFEALKKMHGKAFLEDAKRNYFSDIFDELIKDNKYRIASQPKVDIKEDGDKYVYSMEFEVFPEVQDIDLSKISVNVKKPIISEKDIETEMKTVFDNANNKWSHVTRNAANGDKITIKYTAKFNKKVVDQKQNDIRLGDLPEFDKNLLDHKIGDKLEFDYQYEKDGKKGRLMHYNVEIVDICEPTKYPSIEGDFLKDNGFKDLEEFKNMIKARLQHDADLLFTHRKSDDIVKKLIAETNFEVPESMKTQESKYVFDEWSTEDHKIVDGLDQSGIIYNLLTTGNKNYESLLKINFDHILINIDADGDGSPDDPEQFLSNNPVKKAEFENAVANLAQTIYKEAIYIYDQNKEDTSIKDILSYIKGEFEEGNKLHSDPNKTWSDPEFTKFNFLLTVESLGDIDQSSVNNYVVPFADYVKNVYKTAVNNSDITNEYKKGTFIIYNSENNESQVLNKADQADNITKDTLCKTVYGYHLLVLNSYDEPDSTRYTDKTDSEGYQKNIKILINEHDEDTEDDNVFVVIEDSYNDNTKEVNFKQFFIYYIQSNTGVTSTLDSKISSLLSSMYSDVISMYKNSNFQNYLFLDLLKIETADYQDIINAEKTYYQNTVTSYDSESIYTDWVNGTYNWTRPDFKEKSN